MGIINLIKMIFRPFGIAENWLWLLRGNPPQEKKIRMSVLMRDGVICGKHADELWIDDIHAENPVLDYSNVKVETL